MADKGRVDRAGVSLHNPQIEQLRSHGRIAPPLTITDAELAEGLDILDDALAAVLGCGVLS
jgi:4-aminobutyrate aminotransferase-like enzyme